MPLASANNPQSVEHLRPYSDFSSDGEGHVHIGVEYQLGGVKGRYNKFIKN
jgi:hypothetical protein